MCYMRATYSSLQDKLCDTRSVEFTMFTSNEIRAKCPRDIFSTFFGAADVCVRFGIFFSNLQHYFPFGRLDAAAQFHSNGKDELLNKLIEKKGGSFLVAISLNPDLPCGTSRTHDTRVHNVWVCRR